MWRRLRQLPDLRQEQWAYLAGLFDGEGAVSFNHYFHKPRGAGVRSQTLPRIYVRSLFVCISVTAMEALQQARDEVGAPGSLMCSYRPPPLKSLYRWTMVSRTAEWFLRGTLPYLKIKKRHAELGLAFRTTVRGGNGKGSFRPTEEELAERERIAAELIEINRRVGKRRASYTTKVR